MKRVNKQFITAAIAPLLALAGCVTYQPPAAEGSATLSIRNPSDTMRLYPRTFVDGRTCSGGRMVGMSGLGFGMGPRGDAESKIDAGKEFTLSLLGQIAYGYPNRTISSCTAYASFVPQAGQRYVTELASGPGGCRVEVFVDRGGSTPLQPEPSLRPRRPAGSGDKGGCLPD